MEMLLDNIIEPTLLLNEDICRANIARMTEKATNNGLPLRPHFKTHQSHVVGSWFREAGIDRIAVSSFRMAQYFAQDGWKDITVAFPTNYREIKRINELAKVVQLNVVVENRETLAFLEQYLRSEVQAFIKADIGYHRTGLGPDKFDQVDELIEWLSNSSKLHFKGFLAHAGHSYGANGLEEIKDIHEKSLANLALFKERYQSGFPQIEYSAGDTPTCSRMSTFGVATEMRPGNFVFYDLSQCLIGSCEIENIAVAMACPVVAIHKERSEIVLYGGGVHFSKDRKTHPNGETFYGLVVDWQDNGWESSWEHAYIKSLSQEHGIVKATQKLLKTVKVGDILGVLPIHSCMNANLMKQYLSFNGQSIGMMAYP